MINLIIHNEKTVVYDDGNVCISILHPPGDDPLMYERSSERWSPIQSVEKVLLSVISMLAEPNIESPANIGEFNLYQVIKFFLLTSSC